MTDTSPSDVPLEGSTEASLPETNMTDTTPTEDSRPDEVNDRMLRRWPAMVLLLLMAALTLLPSLFNSPSFAVMMLGFMGPPLAGLMLLVWWCFGSRASTKEKVLGVGGWLAIALVTIGLLHPSMRGMSAFILVLPTGIAAFGLALVVLAKRSALRVPVALIISLLAMGYWDLRQSEGVTGSFKNQLLWRWEPTAEERYLTELADRPVESDGDSSAAIPASLGEGHWPEFRGSGRQSVVHDVTLSEDWDNQPPREVWRTRVGPGWSSFSVAGERLFTQEQRGDEEAVVCLDASNGETVWSFTYPSRFWEAIGGAGPRATPTIAGDRLYALGADGILLCLQAADGTEVWRRDLKQDAEREPPQWGFSSSPLVSDETVIVHAGGEGDGGVLAYRAADGEPLWSVASGDHSYSSPHLATFDDTEGILMMTNAGLQFLDPEDGRTIWEYAMPSENYRALQPLVQGRSVLIATSLAEGTVRITVSQNDEGEWQIDEDWDSRGMKPEFNDYVFADGYVYGFDGSIFGCIDFATGERQWKRGRYGNGQVLLLADSGQLLVISEKGELVLLRANPERLEEVGRVAAIEGKTWNHPVLVDDRLYVRNAAEAACFEVAVSGQTAGEDEPGQATTAATSHPASVLTSFHAEASDQSADSISSEKSSDAIARKPVLVGEPWKIALMPDLGELSGPIPRKQHIVDHGFIRDINGDWQLWACMRGTKVGRLLYGWEGESIRQGPWKPKGIVARADSSYGEKVTDDGTETIQAPHFRKIGETWYCFYNSAGVRYMTSRDGIDYTRAGSDRPKEQREGANLLGAPGGRDVMILSHDDVYYSYATVSEITPEGKKRGYVVGSSSPDLQSWSPPVVVSEGGSGGPGLVDAESPFVQYLDGYFYLFRSSSTSGKTFVYRSTDPLRFNQNNDDGLVADLPIWAPEIMEVDGEWYISDLGDFQALLIHRLEWPVD